MTLKKIVAVLTVIAATALGGLVFPAHAVTYVYDSLNRLTEVHFDDSTGIIYTYDDIGNVTTKTYSNATYPITVISGPGGTVSPSSSNVNYGGSQTFTISPNTGYYPDVLVDEVDQGAITSYTFSNVTAAHTISATFAIDTFSITASAGANGSISPTNATVNYGGSQTFTISPNAGYYPDVLVDGVDQGAITSYTFSNVTAAHTISATFAIDSYTVTPSAGTGGSISPTTPQTVNYDGTTSFTVTPNTGFSIGSVTGCGGTLSGSTYTTGPITGNCSVTAAFPITTYTVTPSAGAGGSISPTTPQTVNYDGTTSFTVTPNTGFSIGSVTGCGGSLSGNTYTTGQVTGNCTVTAAFPIATYTVTPSAGAGGSISPTTPQTVNYDGTTSFTVTPNTGHSIGSVTGCGGTLSGSTYTTGPITGNCSVTAAFPITTYTVTPSAGAGGSISPTTPQTVNYDGTTSFTVTPNTGFSIGSVTGCGGTLSGSTYTTGPITGNCSVTAVFPITTYTVTPSAGAGGSISPSTAQTVSYDGTTSFTVTPNTGYSISSVTGCGGSLSGNTYTTGPVTANCSVSAAFTMNTYTITASAGVNGSISPSGASVVNQGTNTTYTIAPISGQVQILNVVVDGVSQGAISSYTFSNVQANHSINATFQVIAGSFAYAAGTYYWTAPFTGTIYVQCIGGGGSGGGGNAYGAAGGGGGAYAYSSISVTYGVQYSMVVGGGGAGVPTITNGNPGGITYWYDDSVCYAGGGGGGGAGTANNFKNGGAAGVVYAANITAYNGGAGAAGVASGHGGAGGNSGNGAAGGAGGSASAAAVGGGAYGGAGGGGHAAGAYGQGAAGATGAIFVNWGAQ